MENPGSAHAITLVHDLGYGLGAERPSQQTKVEHDDEADRERQRENVAPLDKGEQNIRLPDSRCPRRVLEPMAPANDRHYHPPSVLYKWRIYGAVPAAPSDFGRAMS